MPRFARARGDDGSIVVALLMMLAFAGLSLVLLASTLSHVKSAQRDRNFTSVLPAGDAAIQRGLLHVNAGRAADLPGTWEVLSQDNGRQARWFAAAQSSLLAPPSYLFTAETLGTTRTLRAEAFQSRRFPVAAFADQSVVFNGSNGARSYDSRSGTTASTGRGRVGSNGSVTLHGNSTSADGVDLYNWESNGNTGRCSHSGGTTCTSLNTVDERLDITSASSTEFIRAKTSASTCNTAYSSPASTTALASGEHCFSSLALNGDITLSGPTVIYVRGDVFIDHHLRINFATGIVPNPSLLQIYMLGTSYNMTNHTTIAAAIYAPLAHCRGGAQSVIYGSLICRSIQNNGGWQFYYDDALSTIGDGQFRLRNYREG